MNEFEEFIESMILAEKISSDNEMAILANDDPMYKYEIRVDCFLYEEKFSYAIYVSIKPKSLLYHLVFDEMPIYLPEYELNKANNQTVGYKGYLNKRFKGTLSIDAIYSKPLNILQIKGSFNSLKEFLANHKQIYIDFLNSNKKSP